jgi:spore maturation protein A
MKAGNRKIEISCFFVYTRVLRGNSKFFRKVRVTILTQGGLRAMSDLEELEWERGNSEFMDVKVGTASANGFMDCGARTASNEMCTFLVMNISSLQLIPVNIIAYRSQYGSANPAAVIAPAIVATFFSTVVAVIYCKMMNRKQRV